MTKRTLWIACDCFGAYKIFNLSPQRCINLQSAKITFPNVSYNPIAQFYGFHNFLPFLKLDEGKCIEISVEEDENECKIVITNTNPQCKTITSSYVYKDRS